MQSQAACGQTRSTHPISACSCHLGHPTLVMACASPRTGERKQACETECMIHRRWRRCRSTTMIRIQKTDSTNVYNANKISQSSSFANSSARKSTSKSSSSSTARSEPASSPSAEISARKPELRVRLCALPTVPFDSMLLPRFLPLGDLVKLGT